MAVDLPNWRQILAHLKVCRWSPMRKQEASSANVGRLSLSTFQSLPLGLLS